MKQPHQRNSLLGKSGYSLLFRSIATQSFGMLVLIISSIVLSFVISVVLARLLGAADYGAYALVLAWIGSLSVLATFGLQAVVVRKVALYKAQSSWSLMRGLIRKANILVLSASLIIVFLVAIVLLFNSDKTDSKLLQVFWISLILLPLNSVRNIRQAILRGLQHVIVGQLPEKLVQPILFIILIGSMYFLSGETFSVVWAMGMYIVSVAFALVISIFLVNRKVPSTVKCATPKYQTAAWIYSALPLLAVGILHTINIRADILMLGMI